MTDPLRRLEAELASLRPASLSPRVVEAVANELASESQPLRFADRCLIAVMSAGSLAACVIVALVMWQFIASAAPPLSSSPSPFIAVQSPTPAATPTLGQYKQALARSGDVVPEILR